MQPCVHVFDVGQDLHRELEEEELLKSLVLRELGRPGNQLCPVEVELKVLGLLAPFFLQLVPIQVLVELLAQVSVLVLVLVLVQVLVLRALLEKGTPPGDTCSAGRRPGS